ncbi:hypothetical protein [Limnobacter sp.]|uniref:hypothetical protein n=1 Tax=Limnobacter sp. TaxID=2003368 RepID=UPI0025C628C4|nr:hypothetical protein [Limnobacter sp.]
MRILKFFVVVTALVAAGCGDPEPNVTDADVAIDKKQKAVLEALEKHKEYLESDQYKIDQKKRIERMEETRKRAREFFEYAPSSTEQPEGTKK